MNKPTEAVYQHRRKHPLPDIEQLRQRYRYDPETGHIFGPRGRIGSPSTFGYIIVSLKTPNGYVAILAHRLAYAFMTGIWPNVVDHINGQRADNRWTNLRNVTVQENALNRAFKSPIRYLFRAHCQKTKQGFRWNVKVPGQPDVSKRDFCKAWHSRRKLLALQEKALVTQSTEPPDSQPKTTQHAAYARRRSLPDIGYLRDRYHYD